MNELTRLQGEAESLRRSEAWISSSEATFKIASLNKLLMGDCLLFQETSLNDGESLKIPKYRESFYTSFGKGKGIARYP